jgi:hypothetical protein
LTPGQKLTFEMLIVLALLVVFASGYGKGFWTELLTWHPYTIKPPQVSLPSLLSGGAISILPTKGPQ